MSSVTPDRPRAHVTGAPLENLKVTARFQGFAAAGGMLGALASMSCCLLPLALFGLGVSGAWIGNLTALAPYQPYFIAATAACLATGFWLAYRRPRPACASDGGCATPTSQRGVKSALWLATVLVIGAVTFNYTSSWLLGG
jgi:mercuric ion transport protein